ncbi:hypothetical protein [Streptomyces sp. NRRL F-5755]|uniref:hypothetical protein n=1 Tax=Streptomyces sp. NRRL F-5755 TaxID=1519475 RepID=UPI000B04D3E9|nr:hypothetical protein [Streptomyces sp. NRRL F-5755]
MPPRTQEPTVTLCCGGRPLTLDPSRPLDRYALRITEANQSALTELFDALDILEHLIGEIRDTAHETVAGTHTCLAQSVHRVQSSLVTVEALGDLTRRLLPGLAPPEDGGGRN